MNSFSYNYSITVFLSVVAMMTYMAHVVDERIRSLNAKHFLVIVADRII